MTLLGTGAEGGGSKPVCNRRNDLQSDGTITPAVLGDRRCLPLPGCHLTSSVSSPAPACNHRVWSSAEC